MQASSIVIHTPGVHSRGAQRGILFKDLWFKEMVRILYKEACITHSSIVPYSEKSSSNSLVTPRAGTLRTNR